MRSSRPRWRGACPLPTTWNASWTTLCSSACWCAAVWATACCFSTHAGCLCCCTGFVLCALLPAGALACCCLLLAALRPACMPASAAASNHAAVSACLPALPAPQVGNDFLPPLPTVDINEGGWGGCWVGWRARWAVAVRRQRGTLASPAQPPCRVQLFSESHSLRL